MGRSFGFEATVEVIGAVLKQVLGVMGGDILDQIIDLLLVGGMKRRRHDGAGSGQVWGWAERARAGQASRVVEAPSWLSWRRW